MAYKRKTWKNDSSTPLNADGLNDFDKRVGDAVDEVEENTNNLLGDLVHVITTPAPTQTGWQGAKQIPVPPAFKGNFAVVSAWAINDNNVLLPIDLLSARPHRSIETVNLELRTGETWALNRNITIVIINTKIVKQQEEV